MNVFELMQLKNGYNISHSEMPINLQNKAKKLCFKYNSTKNIKKRSKILKKLLGSYNPLVFIEPTFHCDYGFNIHTKGLTIINYNCVILDTSVVNIGKNVFIAPGVCIACSGHPINPTDRNQGILTSKPITIEDDVWIGANVTVCGGVTIGKGSVIGAGSVVTKDIPPLVVAAGNPCRVLRVIDDNDKVKLNTVDKYYKK